MAGKSARDIVVNIIGNAKGLQAASKDGEKALSKWRTGFDKWNRRAVAASTAVVGAAIAAGKDFIGLAQNAEQSLGAVDAVFTNNAEQVHAWAKSAATDVGLSAHAYREMATIIGSQLKNMGVPMDEVADQSNELVKRGADLAAMFGGTTAEAVESLSSLLRGETDPIERYGVSIKEADIAARMAADGTDKLEGAQKKAARTQAIMALLTEQTAAATGQFARENDTAAGKAQRAQAKWENLRTELGMKLLPIYTQVMGFISGTVLPFLDKHRDTIAAVAAGLTGLATVILTVNGVMKVLNFVMAANPFVLIVALIAALVAAFIYLWKNVEGFREFWITTWEVIKAVFSVVMTAIKTAAVTVWNAITAFFTTTFKVIKTIVTTYFNVYKTIITTVFNTVRSVVSSVWGGIRSTISGVVGAIKSVVSSGFNLVKTYIINPIRSASSTVKGIIDGIAGFFTSLPGRIRSGFSTLGSAIKSPFTSALNGIKSLWNNTVGRVSFKVPGWVPGVGGKGWSFPRLAAGGVAREGRAYLVGEKGPELFTPGVTGRVTPNNELGGNVEVHVGIAEGYIAGVAEVVVKRNGRQIRRAVVAGAGAVL